MAPRRRHAVVADATDAVCPSDQSCNRYDYGCHETTLHTHKSHPHQRERKTPHSTNRQSHMCHRWPSYECPHVLLSQFECLLLPRDTLLFVSACPPGHSPRLPLHRDDVVAPTPHHTTPSLQIVNPVVGLSYGTPELVRQSGLAEFPTIAAFGDPSPKGGTKSVRSAFPAKSFRRAVERFTGYMTGESLSR